MDLAERQKAPAMVKKSFRGQKGKNTLTRSHRSL